MTLVNLDDGGSLYDNPLAKLIMLSPAAGAKNRCGDLIARKRERPFFIQKQVRPRDGGHPGRAIAFVEAFFERNAGLPAAPP